MHTHCDKIVICKNSRKQMKSRTWGRKFFGLKLRQKVAIITGAGSGIDRPTAILFAQEGARVGVADARACIGS